MNASQSAQLTVDAWQQLHTRVCSRLITAQQRQKHYADQHRRDLLLEPGEKVLLSTRHLNLQVPTRKFADRYVGPFRVLERVGPTAYRLDLANSRLSRLHNVFHVSLLKPYASNGLQQQPPPI